MTRDSDRRPPASSPAQYLLVLCGLPWAALMAFEWLGDLADWRPLGSTLLPFDGFVTEQELLRAALGLGALLCMLRLVGVLRGWAYVATGVGAALGAAVTAMTDGALPFWSASAAIGCALAALSWLVLRPGSRPGRSWVRVAAGIAVTPLVLMTSCALLLDRVVPSDARFVTSRFPTPDGGTVSTWALLQPSLIDSYTWNAVVYRPPGWWVRAERVAELDPDETLVGVHWHAHEAQRAVLLETSKRSLAVKRYARERPSGPDFVSWVAPRLDFPCLWRGFETAGSRTDEKLVPVVNTPPWSQAEGELLVDVRAGARYCERPGAWSATEVDLSGSQVREESRDLSYRAPRTLVYSARQPDFDWTFDLEGTLAANPRLQPLPLGDVIATMQVIRVPAPATPPPDLYPFRLPAHLDEVLSIDGAKVVCRDDAPLRQLEPVTLTCPGATLGPDHYVVTGLWGDPNPGLVAVSLPEHHQHLLLRLDTNNLLPIAYGSNPVEKIFLRLERR